MGVDEERAALLRQIASGGYSPFEDQDGSTANTLLQLAEELAPVLGTVVPKMGTRRAGWARRWWLRLKLRAKMRLLGMIPLLLLAVRPLHAQSDDSLFTTALVRQAIGEWRDGVVRPFCLVWIAERPDRPHVLVLLDAVPADTTDRPLCPAPGGGFYPVLVDAPSCPRDDQVVVRDRPFVIVRCGDGAFARYRPPPEKRT